MKLKKGSMPAAVVVAESAAASGRSAAAEASADSAAVETAADSCFASVASAGVADRTLGSYPSRVPAKVTRLPRRDARDRAEDARSADPRARAPPRRAHPASESEDATADIVNGTGFCAKRVVQ